VDNWLNGDVENGQYFDHVASWYAHKDDLDVLLVCFEELKKDPSTAIQKIAYFVGTKADPDDIEEVLKLTSF